MLKKTINYVDYDGNERTGDFYFNLTRTEVTKMEVSTDGGLEKYIEKIAQARDVKSIFDILRNIILSSYGEISPDSNRFIKSQEIRDAFEQTLAYDSLFMELVENPEILAAFINAIIPQVKVSNN